MSDRLVRALASEGAVRIVAVDGWVGAVEVAAARARGPGASKLAAEMIVASLLMGARIKGDERVTLQLQTEDPRSSAIAEVDAHGNVRGRVTPSDLPVMTQRSGMLLAIKSSAERELYRGVTAVDGETVAQALSSHLRTSAQVDGAIAIDTRGGLAGGVLVERLPQEEGLPSIDPTTFRDRYADIDEDVVAQVLAGQIGDESVDVLGERSVQHRCRCTRDKVAETLLSLGRSTSVQLRD